MKKIYAAIAKVIVPFLILLSFQHKVFAQTTLIAGDIAFTGYIANAVGTDEFSFVLLKDVVAGTQINFTDNGWNGTALTSTEQACTLTFSAGLVAGREITIKGPSGATGATALIAGMGTSAGSVTGLTSSLATSGDQLIAYQGTLASPTIITGIHMNEYTAALPPPRTMHCSQYNHRGNMGSCLYYVSKC